MAGPAKKKGVGKKGSSGKPAVVAAKTTFLKFYADTDHSGAVEQSDDEWKKRKLQPGAILIFNCDRDGAPSPSLDFQDDKLVNAAELKDVAKLVVKKNAKLLPGYDGYIVLSPLHAQRVRIFDSFGAGANAVAGMVGGAAVDEFHLKDIRTKDYELAIEALRPVLKVGEETVEIHVVMRKGVTEKSNDHVLFTIAPWLLLSNIEEVRKAYVSNMRDSAGSDNTVFTSALGGILGGKLQKIPAALADVEVWMQDLIEVGISVLPGGSPMHQFINSRNAEARPPRKKLFEAITHDMIASDFGHIEVARSGFNSLDSFGNLEVTPPVKKYPFGRIFYGYPDPGYSPAHIGAGMGTDVENILLANKYQPAIKIPTNWLAVGHVDEFLSFVPDLKAAKGGKGYKLLMASPRVAIRLCKDLKKAGRGSALICSGKGPGFEISVDDFLTDVGGLLSTNNAVEDILTKIRTSIIRTTFDLPYVKGKDDIIELPVIFNGTKLPGGKMRNAIARTAGMVNCLVVKPDVIVPKPFGPKNAAGKDVFEEYAKTRLEALGLKFHPVDDWDDYHTMMGEIHCGTNARREMPKSWKWWDRKLKIG